MNDELDKSRRQLEEATAPESAGHVPADEQTASLREGWLALGHLLEAAQPIDEPFELRPSLLPSRRTAARRRIPLALVNMAVSLAIVAVAGWVLVNTMRSGAPVPGPNEMATTGRQPQAPIAEARPVVSEAPTPEAPALEMFGTAPQDVPAADPFDWDDSFDDQLALVGEEVIRMEEDWYDLDVAFEPILDGMEQMERDFEDHTL